MKAISYAIVGLMIVMAFLPMTTKALNTEGIPVDNSDYVDSVPKIFGNYIIWVRYNNMDDNSEFQLYNPSWIVLYNIAKNEIINITPVNTIRQNYGGVDFYYNCRNPVIHGNYILYENITGQWSYTYKTYLYNITTGYTELYQPNGVTFNAGNPLSPGPIIYNGGAVLDLYNEWTFTTFYNPGYSTHRPGYLYNHKTNEYRLFCPFINS